MPWIARASSTHYWKERNEENAMSEPTQPQGATFQIEKIYVKDLSLEIPNAPQIFMQPSQPQLEVQIDTGATSFAEGYFEATVSATVTAKVGERTLFLAEAVQAGIFQMRNVPQADLDPLLGIACPTILFPYLREAISDLAIRGGFPPVLLAPVSFEALFMQRQQQQQQQGPASDESKIELAR
jgi:preprotein translocase subunit SecB